MTEEKKKDDLSPEAWCAILGEKANIIGKKDLPRIRELLEMPPGKKEGNKNDGNQT